MTLGDKLLGPQGGGETREPKGITVVVDTSFLKALSNRHLWAYQAILRLESAAHSQGIKWEWHVPSMVLHQYNRLLQEQTLEEGTKNRLALHSIEDLLNAPRSVELLLDASTQGLARTIWKDSPEGRRQAISQHPREAGRADLSIIESALGIAQNGAQVYVASSDFKDVIRPLEHSAKFKWITPLAPSEIDLKYWRVGGQELPIKATLTGRAISDLQGMEESSLSYYIVVFEKNVRSGNATFDAGVGVVKKNYDFTPFELPGEYSSIGENYRLLRAVKVKSLKDEKSKKKIAYAIHDFGLSELVVVEEIQPYFPTLVTVGSRYVKSDNLPLYRTDLDFLYWQTRSEFAKATHKPVFTR